MIWAFWVNAVCGQHATCDTSLPLSQYCLENLPCSALLSTPLPCPAFPSLSLPPGLGLPSSPILSTPVPFPPLPSPLWHKLHVCCSHVSISGCSSGVLCENIACLYTVHIIYQLVVSIQHIVYSTSALTRRRPGTRRPTSCASSGRCWTR